MYTWNRDSSKVLGISTCTCTGVSGIPGRIHGHGRYFETNVLTFPDWACTRRVGVISSGRIQGLLRYVTVSDNHSKYEANSNIHWLEGKTQTGKV